MPVHPNLMFLSGSAARGKEVTGKEKAGEIIW
jgi:hypothetical protein